MLYYETIAPSTLELLKELQTIQGLNHTRLVGGTSLALQIGHRMSVDLDLFAHNLQEDFLSIIAGIKKKGLKIEMRKQSANMLISMINNIKVDIVNYPYSWLENEIHCDDITLATKKDIAAMKLSAITNRGTKKDFIDLYYLLKTYSLEQMLSFYAEKYTDSSPFMVLKSLSYFDDADLEAPPVVTDKSISWESVKYTIIDKVKQII